MPVMQESRKSRSISPEPLWLQGCFAVPVQSRAWGGQRAGASPVQPAKPRARESLRTWGQKSSCEGGSRGGFGPFSLSLTGELRGPCHPLPSRCCSHGWAEHCSGAGVKPQHEPTSLPASPQACGTLPHGPHGETHVHTLCLVWG